MKLMGGDETKTQGRYYPDQPKRVIPELEICWGSSPIRRPANHRFHRCDCPSTHSTFAETDRIENLITAERTSAGADPAFKSTSIYLIMVNGSPVAWRSKRQTSVAKSTTEAEYIACSKAACELIWLSDLLTDAGLLEEEGPILSTNNLKVDNKGYVVHTR